MKKQVKWFVTKTVCSLIVAVIFFAAVPMDTVFGSQVPDCPYVMSPDYIKDRQPEDD